MTYSEPNLNIVDLPAMELFPTLKPLLLFNGSEVPFGHQDKKFIISSIDKENPNNPTVKLMFIGIWEVRDGKKHPVGFCHAWFNRVDKVVTLVVPFNSEFEDVPDDFSNLSKITYKDSKIKENSVGAMAFVLDTNYRKMGIGDVFQAQTMAVFQGLGAEEINYVGDITVHSDSEQGFIPQYKTDGRVAWEQPETSFYSKWSTGQYITPKDGDHDTRIKTALSGMQISILKLAGL